MTQQQLREFTFKVIDDCIKRNCYIKGYGDQFRIMDEVHSPVRNISKEQMNVLKHNDIFIRSGLVYVLNITANPYTHYLEIKLPER